MYVDLTSIVWQMYLYMYYLYNLYNYYHNDRGTGTPRSKYSGKFAERKLSCRITIYAQNTLWYLRSCNQAT